MKDESDPRLSIARGAGNTSAALPLIQLNAMGKTLGMTSHPSICIELRPIEEHATAFPKRRRHPTCLPLHAPMPRKGEVVYLSSTSAWGVQMVVHEWRAVDELRVVVWLEHLGPTHHAARPEFALTQ